MDSYFMLSSHCNRAGDGKRREKERVDDRGRGGERCAGGREDDEGKRAGGEREQPGWRHGGTGSAKRDGNMRDTLRSPTVRLIRSGLPWNV